MQRDCDCAKKPHRRPQTRATLLDFAEQTTAHGFHRLTQGSLLRRILWCCIITTACIGFGIHLSQLVSRYLSWPVSTEFVADEADFRFPDVTICPTDLISLDYGTTPVPSNYTYPGRFRTLKTMIFDLAKVDIQLKQTNWSASMPRVFFAGYADARLALKSIAYRGKFFQEPYETVIYCRFNWIPCDFRNFTIYKDDERFLCMTFTPANRSLVRAGPGNGLYMLLMSNSESYLTEEEEIDYVPGFSMALHEPGTKPDFTNAVLAPLGQKSTVGIHADLVETLDRASSPCDEQQHNETMVTDYSRPGDFETASFIKDKHLCQIIVMQEEFVRECGCLATHLVMPVELFERVPVCHSLYEEIMIRDIFPANDSSGRVYYKIRNATWPSIPLTEYLKRHWDKFNQSQVYLLCYKRVKHRQETQGVSAPACRHPCTRRLYSSTVRLAAWPQNRPKAWKVIVDWLYNHLHRLMAEGKILKAVLRMRNFLPSYLRENKLGVVDLYPVSTKVTVSKETWNYELRNLFSDLGGILGLWVGVSIMTLLEVVQLGIDIAATLVRKSRVDSRDTGEGGDGSGGGGGGETDRKTEATSEPETKNV